MRFSLSLVVVRFSGNLQYIYVMILCHVGLRAAPGPEFRPANMVEDPATCSSMFATGWQIYGVTAVVAFVGPGQGFVKNMGANIWFDCRHHDEKSSCCRRKLDSRELEMPSSTDITWAT